jgi:Glucodextranase, domain B
MPRPLALASLLLLTALGCDRGLGDEKERDAVAPRVEVSEPPRGEVLEGADRVTVVGKVTDEEGLDYVTVNGEPVPLDAKGGFRHELRLAPGVTLIEVLGRDLAGNEERDTRAVMAGTLVPVDTKVEHAFKVNLDAEALRVAGVVAGNALREADLTALLADLNPVARFDEDCIGARLDITKVDKGAVSLEIDPRASGLHVEGYVEDVDLTVAVTYRLTCESTVETVHVKVDRLYVTGTVAVALVGGKLKLELQGLQTRIEGLDVEQGILPAEIVAFIEGPASVFLGSALGTVLAGQLPRLLGRFVGERGVEQTVEILGKEVSFALEPTQVELDETGLRIELDSRFAIPGQDYGSRFVISPDAPPDMDAALPVGGFRIGLADDALNQVLAAMWAAGVIDQDFDVSSGDYAGLGILFDRVQLSLALPPFVVALPGGQGLEVRVGDLTVSVFKKQPNGEELMVTQIALSARLNVRLEITAENKFHLVLDEPTAFIDVLRQDVSGANPLAHADFEELGSFTVANLASLVTQMLENVPVPVFYGATIEGGSVFTGGPAGGYLIANGRLVER